MKAPELLGIAIAGFTALLAAMAIAIKNFREPEPWRDEYDPVMEIFYCKKHDKFYDADYGEGCEDCLTEAKNEG